MTDKDQNNNKESDSKQHGSPAPQSPERLDKQDIQKPQIPDVNPHTVQPGHRDREQI